MQLKKITAVCFLLGSSTALHAGDWTKSLGYDGILGLYNDADEKQNIFGGGLQYHAEYLERYGYSFGYSYANVSFKQQPDPPGPALPPPTKTPISQHNIFGSYRYYSTPDLLPGKVTYRIDGHYIDNNDSTGDTDQGLVIQPIISFLPFSKSYYFDLGLAHSSYAKNLVVTQATPTFGFAFNDQYDWLQMRGYSIQSNDASRTQNKTNLNAAEIKWTRFFARPWRGFNSMAVSLLAGERVFAVDPDAFAVYNLADLQTGALSMLLTSKRPNNTSISYAAGIQNYSDTSLNDTYNNLFFYVNYTKEL